MIFVSYCSNNALFPSEGLNFCMTKDDSRWENMCINQLNSRGSCRTDSLLGMEECKSPFGTYELNIPVDKELSCGDKGMTTKNCKDLDVSLIVKLGTPERTSPLRLVTTSPFVCTLQAIVLVTSHRVCSLCVCHVCDLL